MNLIYAQYTIKRIMEKSLTDFNGCRIWQGNKNKRGYGLISITLEPRSGKRLMTSAHRAHWIAVNGDLKPDEFVLHKCDNPSCVEIKHLFIGSAKDNVRDCIQKGRRARTHKKHTRLRKYSNDVIKAVREETGTLETIAKKHNMSVGYVSKLRRGIAKPLV